MTKKYFTKDMENMICKNDLNKFEQILSSTEFGETSYEKMFELACFCGNIEMLKLIMKYKPMKIFVTDAFLHLAKEYHKSPQKYFECMQFMIDTHKWIPENETPSAMFWSIFEDNYNQEFLGYISQYTTSSDLNNFVIHLTQVVNEKIKWGAPKYHKAIAILQEASDRKTKDAILKEIEKESQITKKRKI